MNIGKLLRSVARYAKDNPEKVLVVAGMLAPGAVAKVAPKVIKAVAVVKAVKGA